ncbi:MAG: hypothetical protein JST93_04210 [Acidobacteria bacterium]|nr:hypothetical protein [Acidobacteriota bacterium]
MSVLTKEELIGKLQHEIHILLHLCSKVKPEMLDYRPTPKQRSTIELLRYLTVMGPVLLPACQTGNFDGAAWEAKSKAAEAMNFDALVENLGSQAAFYASEIGAMSDADFRKEVELFGFKASTGATIMGLIVCGHTAYRTQLFLYLKACGREELNTMNLWAGVDGSM